LGVEDRAAVAFSVQFQPVHGHDRGLDDGEVGLGVRRSCAAGDM
jgi:hypothetical protein